MWTWTSFCHLQMLPQIKWKVGGRCCVEWPLCSASLWRNSNLASSPRWISIQLMMRKVTIGYWKNHLALRMVPIQVRLEIKSSKRRKGRAAKYWPKKMKANSIYQMKKISNRQPIFYWKRRISKTSSRRLFKAFMKKQWVSPLRKKFRRGETKAKSSTPQPARTTIRRR